MRNSSRGYYVLPSVEFKINQTVPSHKMTDSKYCFTLTEARKTSQHGQSIVRGSDSKVVSKKLL